MPIIATLHSLFQNDEFRHLYFEYNTQKHVCVEGRYRNFCCGEVYKKSEIFNSDPYTLQIEIFTDDFDPCSPIKSKATVHKLCAVYFAIQNFPEQYQSRINYIQLVCLCYSDDINKSTQEDYNNIWQMIVEEIKQLEVRGISVGSINIRGSICWPSFDNLGANTSLGYAGVFSAKYYCRFCECKLDECGVLTKEIEAKNRTKRNYEILIEAIKALEKVDYTKTFGVKRYCLLNDLKDFHITKNISADIFYHDLCEGTMPFVLELIIKFMDSLKIVKQDEITQMIQFSDYGNLQKKNKPSILGMKKANLGQNGSQSKCLFLNFPFIIAKYKDDLRLKNVWNSMESMAVISQILYSKEITQNDLNEL